MATIETRNWPDGRTTYRVKVRLRGHRTESATFRRLTDARRWAQATEAAIREGRYFKSVEAKHHTLRDLVDRYIEEIVPTRPGNARNTKRMLEFWKRELGHLTLADVTPTVIAEQRSRLLTGQTVRKKLRGPATVVR